MKEIIGNRRGLNWGAEPRELPPHNSRLRAWRLFPSALLAPEEPRYDCVRGIAESVN